MKKMTTNYRILIFIFILLCSVNLNAQDNRIEQLRLKLQSINVEAPGLREKADINVNNVVLPDFLRAIGNTHKINLNISSDLNDIVISNNFSNSTVQDVLLFVCKEFDLTIEFVGNILSIKRLELPEKEFTPRKIPIEYDPANQLFSIDLQRDSLYVAFKLITDITGNNLVFEPGLGNIPLTSYIKNMPFDSALDKIAFANNITVTKTRDNYYLFEKNNLVTDNQNSNNQRRSSPQRRQQSNYFFKITDAENKILDVDFENISIASIVKDIGMDLDINMFTTFPLADAGVVSVKANSIAFDLLLTKILENSDFTYKKQDDIYYFGKKENASLRNTVTIPLQHRSIEIMSNQGSRQQSSRNSSSRNQSGYSNSNRSNTNSGFNNNSNQQSLNTRSSPSFSSYDSKAEALISILPDEIKQNLDVKIDIELNSFIVSGPSSDIEKFREFIKYIDKPIPVITIEVMILEVSKTATIETGISLGLGDAPSNTQGGLFPGTDDLTIGASTINKFITRRNGLGALNIGQVTSNFYMQIKAMESNGDINIRSTPKLSTLNGHRSNLSIGETTYYVVTDTNYYGSQISQSSEVKNYYPIEAELGVSLKPLVSGDGDITMEINVIQSSFTDERIEDDAPPNMNSREFTSIVRVKDQDLIVLGGLEEKVKNDTGSGVPLLARIPIIKWFFSSRKRENSSKRLVILIKPTVIY